MSLFIAKRVNEQAAIQEGRTWRDMHAEASRYEMALITVESLSTLKEWSDYQRKWLKGVLLPALAADTGESVGYWEDLLKLRVMPDVFAWKPTRLRSGIHKHLQSIKILSMTQMNEFILGSVAHLRDETIYGDKFQWVQLPNPNLRKCLEKNGNSI